MESTGTYIPITTRSARRQAMLTPTPALPTVTICLKRPSVSPARREESDLIEAYASSQEYPTCGGKVRTPVFRWLRSAKGAYDQDRSNCPHDVGRRILRWTVETNGEGWDHEDKDSSAQSDSVPRPVASSDVPYNWMRADQRLGQGRERRTNARMPYTSPTIVPKNFWTV